MQVSKPSYPPFFDKLSESSQPIRVPHFDSGLIELPETAFLQFFVGGKTSHPPSLSVCCQKLNLYHNKSILKGKVFHIPVFRVQVSGGSQFVKFNEGRTTEPRRSEPESKKAKETWNQAPKAKISMCLKAKVRTCF